MTEKGKSSNGSSSSIKKKRAVLTMKKNYIEMLTRKPNWGSKETSTERKKWIENKIEIYYLNQQECFDEVSR